MSSSNRLMERDFFARIVRVFNNYKNDLYECINKTEEYMAEMPIQQQVLYSSYKMNLKDIKYYIKKNQKIFDKILEGVPRMFENVDSEFLEDVANRSACSHVTKDEIEKLELVLKQLYREWSDDGSDERDACYKPILDEISLNFPHNKCVPHKVNILVPGAGLGRLPFEIARCGYSCQGNEYSLYMLFTSHFLLNRCTKVNSYTIYPWVQQFSNIIQIADQICPVKFPDVVPQELSDKPQSFSMTAGDFNEVYQSNKDEWDCVATCFFIDCHHNIVEVIENIFKILKPGGVWVNLGPLMYHVSVFSNMSAISLTYKDLVNVIKAIGFTIEKEDTNLKTSYCQNSSSMMKSYYNSVFFVCRKPLIDENLNRELTTNDITNL